MTVVDSHDPDQPALTQVEDTERRLPEGGARNRRVPREPRARVLKVELVLVRPEPGRLRKRIAAPRHRLPDREPLPLSGLEVLDPDTGLEQRAPEPRDVSGGIDAGNRRASVLVDLDPVIYCDAGRGRELHTRH